jgi:hypothetical protein
MNTESFSRGKRRAQLLQQPRDNLGLARSLILGLIRIRDQIEKQSSV